MANILRVGFAKNAPEANWNCPHFPTFSPRQSCPYPGLCTELIGYFARLANLTIVPTVIESIPDEGEWGKKQKDGSWSGAFGYMHNDTVDTVCLLAQRNEMRASDFDFTSVIYQTPIALVTRELTETMPPNLWSPYEVFSLQVWVATLIGWMIFTLALTALEAWQSGEQVKEIVAMVRYYFNSIHEMLKFLLPIKHDLYQFHVSWRTLQIQMQQGSFEESFSFSALGNFLAFIYSMTAIVERTFERFKTIEEAASMVASGQLTLIDYRSSITVTLLGEYSTPGTRLLRDAVKMNPLEPVYDMDEVFRLLQTGRYMAGEIIDSRMITQARAQCNLFIHDRDLPDLFVQLLWNRKSHEKLRRINEAIGISREFIERTRKKYLALDELPFTFTKKNCTEQTKLLASQQTLDFPSTAGIFLHVITGITAASVFFIVELLAKWRNSALLDLLLMTKVRRAIRLTT